MSDFSPKSLRDLTTTSRKPRFTANEAERANYLLNMLKKKDRVEMVAYLTEKGNLPILQQFNLTPQDVEHSYPEDLKNVFQTAVTEEIRTIAQNNVHVKNYLRTALNKSPADLSPEDLNTLAKKLAASHGQWMKKVPTTQMNFHQWLRSRGEMGQGYGERLPHSGFGGLLLNMAYEKGLLSPNDADQAGLNNIQIAQELSKSGKKFISDIIKSRVDSSHYDNMMKASREKAQIDRQMTYDQSPEVQQRAGELSSFIKGAKKQQADSYEKAEKELSNVLAHGTEVEKLRLKNELWNRHKNLIHGRQLAQLMGNSKMGERDFFNLMLDAYGKYRATSSPLEFNVWENHDE